VSGLERARAEDLDAIVLDIMLPGLNGYRVCRTLREEGIGTPILMLTAKQGEYDEAEALDTGADDFLSKPFSFVVLIARLRALLRRSADGRAQPLVIGDLVLDPLARTCRRGDTDISLTTREYELLEALMRKPGQVVAKQDLLEKVWGSDFEGDPNVVEVYVGYLRRKIDRPLREVGRRQVHRRRLPHRQHRLPDPERHHRVPRLQGALHVRGRRGRRIRPEPRRPVCGGVPGWRTRSASGSPSRWCWWWGCRCSAAGCC